jgi:phospholipid/cholesterol/gamma-HCH transport system ATP-binding protein
MIEVQGLYKSFADKHVLNDINLKFEPGKPNLVIGASGSGKSVLLKCLVGLMLPDTGNIVYDGRLLGAMDYKEQQGLRREIGMLFQNNALFDSLTVEENVEFPLKMFSPMSASERLDRVNECLAKVNLVNCNSKYPSEISGGMKKRVGIARAIALPIKYLFCDEPNSGLDPLTSRVIDELLVQITEDLGITTVINSHDMKTVADIGHKIIFIYQGQVGWVGSNQHLELGYTENPALSAFFKASF